ncbi:bifunctional lysine-specific demethylase and histidyl-hydroxylase NO66, partial [Asbolus verrucosus]
MTSGNQKYDRKKNIQKSVKKLLTSNEDNLKNMDKQLTCEISVMQKKTKVDKTDEVSLNDDPLSEAIQLFKWLISPVTPETFFKTYWEQRAVHIRRCSENYYTHILDSLGLDTILRNHVLYYSQNVDVVSYENGVKEVHNQEGRAVASALWDYYSNGCSIRILNPQTYSHKVHLLIATLQEYFGAMVGTNVYLTPPGSQGFAPHYDDIEAFVVQLEGRKHWKLYKPKDSDVLARFSSKNLKHDDIGDPIMTLTLTAGTSSQDRTYMIQNVQDLLQSLVKYIDIDNAADQLGKKLMYDSMPPIWSGSEIKRSVKGDGAYLKNGKVLNRAVISLETKIRLLRYYCIRLINEVNTSPKLYYNTENSTVYHGEEEQWLELDYNMIPIIQMLQKTYPNYIKVKELPMEDVLVKMQLISDLWEHGLL